ncbi:MAG: hypothetical protein ABW065_11810 [Solirubrobacterales bacterium]
MPPSKKTETRILSLGAACAIPVSKADSGSFEAPYTESAKPALRPEHRAELLDLSQRSEKLITASWQKGPYRAMRQNALLQLIGVSPELILQ